MFLFIFDSFWKFTLIITCMKKILWKCSKLAFLQLELQINSSSSLSSGGNSRCSSPKPCRLPQSPSRSPQHPAHPGPLEPLNPAPTVVQIETAFKRVKLDCSQTMTVKNYDGSETQRTIVKHRDGTETVTEVTLHPSGEQVAREMVKNLSTGKTSECRET